MRYERKVGSETRYHHYPSIADVLEFEMPDANKERWASCMAEYRNGRTWFGDASLTNGEAAIKVVGTSWMKGLKRADNELGSIALPALPSIKRRRVRKDFGNTLDMNAVYSGRLDRAWQTTERAPRNTMAGGKINLFLNYGIHCGEEADNLFWRGALAAKLIDALQQTGRRVRFICFNNIILWAVNDEPQDRLVLSVVVKDFHHPMSLDKLLTASAFAGFFRTVGFKMILAQEEAVGGGLGRKPDGEHLLPQIFDDSETNIVIGENVTTKAKMLTEMERILKPYQ